jgi:hypothetical protein
MPRPEYRGGQAPIRSALELSLLLPIPLMMIVDGYAAPVFPGTNRSNPSPAVGIIPVKGKTAWPPPSGLPVYIHWKQWKNIVVPLLGGDLRVSGWRGTLLDLGAAVTLLNDIIGPGGEVVFPAGTEIGLEPPADTSLGKLYACDFFSRTFGGKTGSYLSNLAGIIYLKTVQQG